MVHTLFYLNPFSISNISFSIAVLPQQQSFSICLSIYLFIHSSSLSALMDQDSLLFFSSSEVIQIAESGWSSADTLDKLLIYLFPPPIPLHAETWPLQMMRQWEGSQTSFSLWGDPRTSAPPASARLPAYCLHAAGSAAASIFGSCIMRIFTSILLPPPPPLLFRAMFAYAGGEGSSSVI